MNYATPKKREDKTMNKKRYYKALSHVQNENTIIDIMTITAFMNDSQKIEHLERYLNSNCQKCNQIKNDIVNTHCCSFI